VFCGGGPGVKPQAKYCGKQGVFFVEGGGWTGVGVKLVVLGVGVGFVFFFLLRSRMRILLRVLLGIL